MILWMCHGHLLWTTVFLFQVSKTAVFHERKLLISDIDFLIISLFQVLTDWWRSTTPPLGYPSAGNPSLFLCTRVMWCQVCLILASSLLWSPLTYGIPAGLRPSSQLLPMAPCMCGTGSTVQSPPDLDIWTFFWQLWSFCEIEKCSSVETSQF